MCYLQPQVYGGLLWAVKIALISGLSPSPLPHAVFCFREQKQRHFQAIAERAPVVNKEL